MARFFVEPAELTADQIVLTGENAQHAKVLRLKAGEQVLVCDGQGMECVCRVTDVTPQEVTVEVLETRPSVTEARVKASVYMAFPKADKLEHVIQKAALRCFCADIRYFPAAACDFSAELMRR